MNEIVNKIFTAWWYIYAWNAFKTTWFFLQCLWSLLWKIYATRKDFIYRNELDKACFQHDMTYGKSKDLAERTQSDKWLRGKAFKIASDPKYDGNERVLASIVYKFFDKTSGGSGVAIVSKIKNTVPWAYVISDLNVEPIAGSFYEKELQKN